LWFALVPIALGVVAWFVSPRGHTPPSAGGLAPFRDLLAVVRVIGPLVTLSVVTQVGFAAVTAFMTLYFVDARGIPPAVAAALFAFPQLAGVFGAPLGGWLSDRLGRRAVILMGVGGLGPAVLALTLVPNELLLLPLLFVGVAGALRMTVTEVLVVDSAPAERRSTVLGSYYLLSQEVGGLAAPAFGLAAGAVGIANAFSGLGVLLALLSAGAIWFGRRL
jgi:MFS family permease